MASFLIIERDEQTAERIRLALSRAGWKPLPIYTVGAALGLEAEAAPDLAFVEAGLGQGEEVLRHFSRRGGASASIALVSDPTSPIQQAAMKAADQVLHRPVGEEALWAVIAPLSSKREDHAEAKAPAHKMTSEEIFGDLLAEVESDPPAASGQGGERPLAEFTPPSARKGAKDDVNRRLEQTLSGVLGPRRKKPSPSGGARLEKGDKSLDDIDKLLSETLSGLELGRRRKSKLQNKPSLRPDAASSLDLSGLDMPGPDSTTGGPEPRPAEITVEPVDEWMAQLSEEIGRESKRDKKKPPPQPLPASAPPTAPVEQPAQEPPAGVVESVADGVLGAGFATQQISTLPASSAEPAAGQLFGQYRLLERIAVGGMAEVWKARMEGAAGFQKTVAIKKILPQLTENEEFEKMFVDEAKLAAELNHPHITHIYDLGEIHGEYYIAMEYVEGRDLRSILNRAQRHRLPIPRPLTLLAAQRLASALGYAHRKRDAAGDEMGLVHRDVSPQNVLISRRGDIKLCDFGIVKAVSKSSKTQMGALKGKLQYMSPEQAWGKVVDARSDIFSLGSILFEMLTGERLFDGESELSVLDSVRNGLTRAPRDVDAQIPEEFDRLVRKAVEQDPGDRFQSAESMLEEIDRVLTSLALRPTTGELAAYLHQLETSGPATSPVKTFAELIAEPLMPAIESNPSDLPSEPSTVDQASPPTAAEAAAEALEGDSPESLLVPVGPVDEPQIEPLSELPGEPSAALGTAASEEPSSQVDFDSGPLVDAVPPSEEDLQNAKTHKRWLWLALFASLLLIAALAFFFLNRAGYLGLSSNAEESLSPTRAGQLRALPAADIESTPAAPALSSPPVLVSIDEPEYPAIARRARAQGDVILSLLVDEQGGVQEVEVVEGIRSKTGLNEAAVAAAQSARFKPASKDGVRVKMRATLKIPFRL